MAQVTRLNSTVGRDYYVQFSNGGLFKDTQTHLDGVYERAGLGRKEV